MKKDILGNFINTQKGYAFKSSDYKDKGTGIVRVSDFTDNSISENNIVYIDNELAKKYQQYKLNLDDVIIQTVGSWPTNPNSVVGKVVKVPSSISGYLLNQNAVKIIPNEELNLKYLYYLLKSQNFTSYIISCARGAASQASITLEDIKNFEFNKPNFEVQIKIAKILSNYDDLIENNNRRIKILEEMAQKIYKEWFVDFKFPGHETTTFKDSPLGKIPNDWEVKKVFELSTLSKGKSYKSSELVDKKDGLPFLNLKCVERDGGFKREGLKWFCGKYNDNHVVLPEDIIMAVTDMTQERKLVARPARIPHNWYKKYIMSMDLVKLVANNDINKTYLYSLLKYSNFSDEVKNHANGVNVLHLNPQNIEQFELVVASEPLRNNFGEFAKRIFNQIDVLYLKNENLKQTRDILLPRLISGEINVENMEVL